MNSDRAVVLRCVSCSYIYIQKGGYRYPFPPELFIKLQFLKNHCASLGRSLAKFRSMKFRSFKVWNHYSSYLFKHAKTTMLISRYIRIEMMDSSRLMNLNLNDKDRCNLQPTTYCPFAMKNKIKF